MSNSFSTKRKVKVDLGGLLIRIKSGEDEPTIFSTVRSYDIAFFKNKFCHFQTIVVDNSQISVLSFQVEFGYTSIPMWFHHTRMLTVI